MRRLDDALVLRRTPFRETSLLLHLFTRQDGLLTAIARGVRATPRSRTPLERAALAGFHTVLLGRSARSVDALPTITSVEIKQLRQQLLHQAAALMAAQVTQEILYRFMVPCEPNPQVFELLEWAWDLLETGAEPLLVLGICQGRLLRALGYGWRTDCCAGCGRTGQLRFFSAKRGQVVCGTCASPYMEQANQATARGGSGGHRLFPLGDDLYGVVQQLAWDGALEALSQRDKILLYRIGMACLVWLGGTPLVADAPFRQIAGLESSSTPVRDSA
ncbi:MAG: DNA repair protein RecO [Magnetococcales bacterium]|nr:DNA repair protein RecO [Magnetococcales bacterium]